jgi:hypothetical protein
MLSEKLMKPTKEKLIAVIGVSNREDKFGFKIFRDLLQAGYNVVGTHPLGTEVLGKKIYRSLREIEKVPDLVITVVPSSVTEKIIEECKELGIPEVWMQPGSDSEAAVAQARKYRIQLTYNECFMVHEGIW